MTDPVNQEHEEVLNFAHSLPSGLTQEQIYVRIHERAMEEAASRIDAVIAAHNEAVSEQERLATELATCRASTAAAVDESQPGGDLHEKIRNAVCKSIQGNYYCGRVWSAWQVGTMTEDDFTPAEDVDEVLDEIADAVFAVVAAPVAPVPAASEGWTENTGMQPVASDVHVEVELRDGAKVLSPAGNFRWSLATVSDAWFPANDIVKWRPAAPATSDKAEGV